MSKGRVLIAGAGIGGLTAAACLLRKGFDVQIFEQAPKLGEIGEGIQQSTNGVKVLYDLGLKSAIEAVAVKPNEYEFRRFDTGELMHKIPFAQAHDGNMERRITTCTVPTCIAFWWKRSHRPIPTACASIARSLVLRRALVA